MAISDKINSIKTHIGEAYTAIQGKEGTVPANKNCENLKDAIASIPTSGKTQEKTVNITENGVVITTPDTGYDGMSSVTTVTNVQPDLQEKAVTPTEAQQIITPDAGYDGLSKVTVSAIQTKETSVKPAPDQQVLEVTDNKYYKKVTVEAIPPNYIIPTGTVNITANGTHDVSGKASVVVNVEGEKPTLNAPTISLSNSTLTITNPATNGNFVTSYRIFNGSAELAVVTSKTVNLSTLLTDSGTYSITVKASAPNFNNSAASSAVSYEVAAAGYNVTFLSGGDFSWANVYDGRSATGSYTSLQTSSDTVVTCTSGYLYLVGAGYGTDSGVYAPDVTGGVTVDSIDPETSGTGIGDAWILFKVTGDGTVGAISISCFIEGTQITLADRTMKAIEDITYDDELLVWNFYDGKFDTAKPTWIKVEEIAPRYNLVKFSDGREFGTVGAGGEKGYHRVFNKEAGAFTHIGTNATPIGTTTFADDGTNPTIVSEEIIEKPVKYYNIITDKHYNIFANGILTSCRLSNKYHIEDMKYVGEPVIHEQEEKEYRERLEKNRKWLG